jgi:hypothetical protein
MPNLRILCYNGSLVIWTVVSLTTAKFKPLIFSMSGFTLSLLSACTICLLYNLAYPWKMFAVCEYPRKCLLLARSNGLVSKILQTSNYITMDMFNTWRWFVFKNSATVAACLPIRFLEKLTCSNIKKILNLVWPPQDFPHICSNYEGPMVW